MADPYGHDIPSPIDPPTTIKPGEPVPKPGLPERYPEYLKPIPVNTRDVTAQMRGYLNSREPKVQKWLYSTWTAQREAIKYQEIRNAVRDGEVALSWIQRWQDDYVRFVNDVLEPEWEKAMLSGGGAIAEDISKYAGRPFRYTELGRQMTDWINTRGAELAVGFSQAQTDAVRFLIRRYTVDEPLGPLQLARILRPVIGLTPKQAQAVARFRSSLVAEGLPARTIEHQVGNYAGFLHRYRAERIARTELSYAYNYGQFEAVGKARDEGMFRGPVVKEWITAEDERTCDFCGPMDGAIIDYDETFPTMGRQTQYTPPAHPRCRCTVGYRVLERR
jgi:SPP1 gp7 family putative phage head morphogenesis protein